MEGLIISYYTTKTMPMTKLTYIFSIWSDYKRPFQYGFCAGAKANR